MPLVLEETLAPLLTEAQRGDSKVAKGTFTSQSISPIILIMYTNASAWVYFVLFFCLGFTSGAQVIGYPAVAESNSSSVTGTALAIASTLIMAGGFTETLFGWMMHFEGPFKIVNGIHIYSAHSYSLPMLIMPIAMVVSVIMALLFKETHARSISKER